MICEFAYHNSSSIRADGPGAIRLLGAVRHHGHRPDGPDRYQGDGHLVPERQSDGYVNSTAHCKATGRLRAEYWRLGGTAEFVEDLAAVMGNPITGVMEMRNIGAPDEQVIWAHPHIASNLAQWCLPRFAVQVSQWVQRSHR